ncbi:MAG: 4-demethylwyosine synthase TYW1 [archaeon]
MPENFPLETEARLERAGYRIVGGNRRAGVKICSYTKRALLGTGGCYKQKFYGIASHRCLQMAPDIFSCNHRCVFCWRDTRAMGRGRAPKERIPELVRGTIEAQRKLLIGYKGNPGVPPELFSQSENPNQVAISLAGEPTIFPQLGALISAYKKSGCTTFLVTNGTRPEALAKLKPLPTQLYVTLPAPDEKSYRRTCAPVEKGLWKKLLKTLSILPKLRTRKVLRLTLVRGLNFNSPEKYAELIRLARPHYVEVKSYVNVGYSTRRLSRARMLAHEEIREFAGKIAQASDYLVTDEFPDSRVVLLCRDAKARDERIIRSR